MTVLCIDVAPEYGGTTASLLSRLRYADNDRFRSVVFCRPGRTVRVLTELGIPVRPIRFPLYLRKSRVSLGAVKLYNPAIILGHALVLIEILRAALEYDRRERVDIIHGSAFFSNIYASILGLILGRFVIWHMNDSRLLENRRLFMRLERRVSRIVVISKYMEQRLLESGYEASKVEMIYQPVDPREFYPLDRAACRKALNLDPDCPVVGFVGRLDPGKGVELFLRSSALVARQYPATVFLIVGEATDRRYLTMLLNLSEEMGLEDRTLFLGFREDVAELINSMDLLVFPTVSDEAFGRVAAEASACGVPVVASDRGGVSEIVENRVSGILVDPRDTRSLAEAISTLLGDPPLARKMGSAGREKVKLLFSPELHQRKLERAYEKVIGGRDA